MKIKTYVDMMTWISFARKTIKKYGFQDKEVYPWLNLSMTAKEIVDSCADYPRCSRDTKIYLKSLAEGFDEILRSWVQYAEAPKVRIRLKNGKVITIPEDDIPIFKSEIMEVF